MRWALFGQAAAFTVMYTIIMIGLRGDYDARRLAFTVLEGVLSGLVFAAGLYWWSRRIHDRSKPQG